MKASVLWLSVSDFQSPELIEAMTRALKDPDRAVRIGAACGLALRHATLAGPSVIKSRNAAADDDERRELQSRVDDLSSGISAPLMGSIREPLLTSVVSAPKP